MALAIMVTPCGHRAVAGAGHGSSGGEAAQPRGDQSTATGPRARGCGLRGDGREVAEGIPSAASPWRLLEAIKTTVDVRVATQPLPLMGDDGIGEITASLQLQQPRLDGGAIETDVAGLDQGPDGRADRGHREGRQAVQRPDEGSRSEAGRDLSGE
jgi:hypothetical protein